MGPGCVLQPEALVQKDPGEEIWKVYSKQLVNESRKFSQGRFAVIKEQAPYHDYTLVLLLHTGSPGPTK